MPHLDLITTGPPSIPGKPPVGIRQKSTNGNIDPLKKCDSMSSSVTSDGGDSVGSELLSPGGESVASSGYESNVNSPMTPSMAESTPSEPSPGSQNSQSSGSDAGPEKTDTEKRRSLFQRSNSTSALKVLKSNSESAVVTPPPPSAKRDRVSARFSSSMNSSVVTRRNFGFCFGNDITSANAPSNLLLHVDRKAEAELRAKPPVKPPLEKRVSEPSIKVDAVLPKDRPRTSGSPDLETEPKPEQKRKMSAPPKMFEFGEGGLGDRSTNRWMWPGVRQPHIIQDDTNFQVEIDIRPFNDKEVWGKVIGHELVMTCWKSKATDEYHIGSDRWFNRTYQLPMNIDPRTVKFRMMKGYRLIITAIKIPQLKMMVACYIDHLLAKGEEITDKKIADKVYGKLEELTSVEGGDVTAGSERDCPTVPEEKEVGLGEEDESNGDGGFEDGSTTTASSLSGVETPRVGSSMGFSTPTDAMSTISSDEANEGPLRDSVLA